MIVVRAPAGEGPDIACGGAPLIPAEGPPPPPFKGEAATQIGKRYVNAAETVELLCTASGTGELTCDGSPMTRKAAKPLPASD
ncbi:hypothetical protein [Actinomadura monticuli]|uniref:Uncharacterized protein n=1 Tax=Actinomadura monticuli TaxID=3097367 RepID=A0ABV4QHH8_9ACTN